MQRQLEPLGQQSLKRRVKWVSVGRGRPILTGNGVYVESMIEHGKRTLDNLRPL
jgi:hypothetical protein